MSGKRKDPSDQSASNKEQAKVRYRNIIKSPLLATDKARLDQELNMYKQTEDFKRLWWERTRSKTNLDAHDACATIIQDVIDQEACLLKMQPRIASAAPDTSNLSLTDDATASKALSEPTTPIPHATTTTADTTPTDNDQDIFVSAPDTIPDDVGNAIPLQPWIYRGTNVAERFINFKRAIAGITTNQLLFIEPSMHELLALPNILLLCTSQHSPLCIDTSTEDLLDNLNKDLLTECMDFKVDISDDACMKLARIIDNADSKQLAKDDAEIELLMLGKSLCPLGSSLVRGISAAMHRLPLIAIKNKQTIGECELFTMCFDPILTSLFSDPDRKVLLRWSNVISDENGEIRPDATISKLQQRDFGSSLGYGEVKIARPTIDGHALCHDLLRLATVAKDTMMPIHWKRP
ncbi:hypothetical protein [Parasitella parasitica]|uniref:Uncharacterized protein n=1 Tax=Parasitella parasitica TaxID=35722 RepID=A0A0B7MQX1_9FUNG|nr:hypothetical protein [Parasitella parasitica]